MGDVASFFFPSPLSYDGRFRVPGFPEHSRTTTFNSNQVQENEDLTEMKLAESSGLGRCIVTADAMVNAIKTGVFNGEWLKPRIRSFFL